MKPKLIIALAVVIALAAAWRYHRLLFQDDEKRITEIVHQLKDAAEAKDFNAFIDCFSSDYSDDNGNTKFILYQIVKRSLASVDELKVNLQGVDVFVAGDTAWATVTVSTEARRGSGITFPFGTEQEPETPKLTFTRTSTGDWRISRVENVRRSSGF